MRSRRVTKMVFINKTHLRLISANHTHSACKSFATYPDRLFRARMCVEILVRQRFATVISLLSRHITTLRTYDFVHRITAMVKHASIGILNCMTTVDALQQLGFVRIRNCLCLGKGNARARLMQGSERDCSLVHALKPPCNKTPAHNLASSIQCSSSPDGHLRVHSHAKGTLLFRHVFTCSYCNCTLYANICHNPLERTSYSDEDL